MDKPDNFYEVLGITRDATDMDIAQAYRALVPKLQATITPENEAAVAQRIQQLELAYATLLNPEQKKKHDETIAWFIAQQRLAADKARIQAQRLKDEQEAARQAEIVAAQRAADEARQAIEAAQHQAELDRVHAEADARFRQLREERMQNEETRPMSLEDAVSLAEHGLELPVNDAVTSPAQQPPSKVGRTTILASVLGVVIVFAALMRLQPGAPKSAPMSMPDVPSPVQPVAGGTSAATPAVPTAAPAAAAPAKPSKEDSAKAAEAQQYQKVLKQVETEHPELNPRHAAHRPDLIAYVASRMQVHLKAGYPKPKALEIAVRDLETLDATRRAIEKQKAQSEIPQAVDTPPVTDKGGHAGFDPKCRWVNAQEWSCK